MRRLKVLDTFNYDSNLNENNDAEKSSGKEIKTEADNHFSFFGLLSSALLSLESQM